ncbi:MAG: hypothetical protein WBO97_10540 [Tepidiformaceae bacterium]
MTAVMDPPAEIVITFEGTSPGTEIWGATQANFSVHVPGHNAKEGAALLNDPAATMLAEAVGKDDTPEFREAAARAAGKAAVKEMMARGEPFDSTLMISRAYLQERPAVFEAAKAALAE